MSFSDFQQRIDELASRLAERARAARPEQPGKGDAHWQTLQDLFTRDVTRKDLHQLLEHDPRESFRYFTRELDLAALQAESWYRRYPVGAWRIFLALAYRLSPARRVLFAAAALILTLGWLSVVFSRTLGGEWLRSASGFEWALVAASTLFFLLVLELRDKLALKGDLEIARDIQFGLLPFEPFARAEFGIRCAMRPANTVGGDYFDIIELDDGTIVFVMADVAGKGIPAALLMALLQASLRTLLNAGFRSSQLIEKLNRHLCQAIPSNRLVTLFYGELDPLGHLRYVNAGHNPPYLISRDGQLRRLAGTGIVLGVVPEEAFANAELTIGPGERLFLYTDGVTEAFDKREEEYGEARLEALLMRHRSASAQELLEALKVDVLEFCGFERPHDDMTTMLVTRAG
jgi:serine phosphatase RsbU (regulator of sigma subunit)